MQALQNFYKIIRMGKEGPFRSIQFKGRGIQILGKKTHSRKH